jgi:hypothetical protein
MLVENFDTKGHLVGLAYESNVTHPPDDGHWWKGKPVSKEKWLNARWNLVEVARGEGKLDRGR